MAILDSTNLASAALSKGAVWGTEVDVSIAGVFLYASNITVSGGFGDFRPRDFGSSGLRLNQKRLNEDCKVSITCDGTFGQGWEALLAGFLGTESAPAEQTGSQGDYLRTLDLAATSGIYWTLAYVVETNKVRCVPSLKITSASFQCDSNNVGSWTFQGVGHSFIESSTNTYAKITGLTAATYESGVLGGTAAYYRHKAYSTSVSLSSSNNLPIMNFGMQMTRPLQTRFALNGANSGYTYEPLQQGDVDASTTIKLVGLDASAIYDMFADWYGAAFIMAELFYSGNQIGATGVNTSLKLQFPYLQAPGAFPTGQDLPGNNQFLQPSLSYTMLKAPAAASGMTSVLNYMRLTSIDRRVTKWTA